jgi:hypothetical protein
MTLPLTPQQLDDIEARTNAATPGPWEPYPAYGPAFHANTTHGQLMGVGDLEFGAGEQAEADAAFVRHAREDIDALLDAYRRLTTELADQADADTIADRATQVITAMGADIRAARAERDRYRAAWQSARFRAQAYGEGILRVVKDREAYQGWLKQAEAENQRLRAAPGV